MDAAMNAAWNAAMNAAWAAAWADARADAWDAAWDEWLTMLVAIVDQIDREGTLTIEDAEKQRRES